MPVAICCRTFFLADRRQAVRSGRVRRAPGAGGIDHSARLDAAHAARPRDPQHEGQILAPCRAHLVGILARDGCDARVELHIGGESRGERFEITRNEVGTGRHVIGWRMLPAFRCEQLRRRTINAVAPGREHADMAPLANVVRDFGAGFQHERLHLAAQEMRGGGEADRPRTNDDDGQRHAIAFRF